MIAKRVQMRMQEAQGNCTSLPVKCWIAMKKCTTKDAVATYTWMTAVTVNPGAITLCKIAQMQSSACMGMKAARANISFMKTVSIAIALGMIAKRVQMEMQEAQGNCTSLPVKTNQMALPKP
jgi:hypothetical protein